MNTFFAKDFADREIERLTKRIDSLGIKESKKQC